MGKRYYSRSNFKKENPRDITKQVKENKGNNEAPKLDTNICDGISKIGMKDLPKSTYAIKTSPYDEANQASQPYNFITKFNDKFQPSYKGRENLDGGYVSQYLTATDTRLLNAIDALKMPIGINFRYLPITHHMYLSGDDYIEGSYEPTPIGLGDGDPVIDLETTYRGSQLLRKMYDAVNEAVSQLDATTFTYLAMNTSYSCLSTLRIPDVPCRRVQMQVNGGNTYHVYCYTDVAAVILLMSIEYQILLQNGLLTLKQINKLKNIQGTLIKMNYNRETGPLNQFFGLFNKSSFTQLLTSIKLNVMGEYVDADWARNTNIVTQLVSRKADDFMDPIMEIAPLYNYPIINIFLSKTTGKFGASPDDFTDDTTIDYNDFALYVIWCGGYNEIEQEYDSRSVNVRTGAETYGYYNLREITNRINQVVSPTEVLLWSRTPNNEITATNRYNSLVWDIEAVDAILTRMKTMFGDLRTVFDKLKPVGIVNYVKGITVDISDDYNVKPVDYMLIDDIYATVLGGNRNITFSNTTGRWTAWSMWDKFTGIPKFDSMSGGAFISFCTKEFDLSNNPRTDYEYLPVIFTTLTEHDPDSDNYVSAVNRLGRRFHIGINNANGIGEINDVCRISILPNFDTADFKAPAYDADDNPSLIERAFIKYTLMNVANTYYDTSSESYDITDSIVAMYHYEIDPIEKPMITYAKAFGPFKGVTDSEAEMGFAGLSTLTVK